MRARVGAMPLPPKSSSQHDQQPQVHGTNRVRVHSGMSLEVSFSYNCDGMPTPTANTREPPWSMVLMLGASVYIILRRICLVMCAF